MKKILKIVMIILLLYIGFIIAQTRNLNGFHLAHYYAGKTQVSRDRKEQYNKEWSYKIDSQDYNDFMIYQTIPVKKNTAYQVSCVVKTEKIESENNNSGFNICLKDHLEKSPSLTGTNDWTTLNFYFNSMNNETVDIAFRLGGNEGNCKGTAWFSHICIEEGKQKETNEWKFAVFMMEQTEAQMNGKKISEKLTNTQINAIKSALERFKNTARTFSNQQIQIDYDVIFIQEPLDHVSYETETGYYVSPQDAEERIRPYLAKGENYDHIFVVANIGDTINGKEIEWIGLGGMVYDTIGYSNIRISEGTLNVYQFSYTNYFPEEVMLHEFLHTLERNSTQLEQETIALHDYAKYGYQNKARYGLREWYLDYMQQKIQGKQGLKEEVFHTQPVSEKNFSKRNNITDQLYKGQNILQKITEKISCIR